MRVLTAAVLLAAVASPATAGPLDTLQYRATLRTDRPTTAGPPHSAGETAYALGGPPEFGVLATSVPEWTHAGPVYLGAGFSVAGAGGLTPFTAANSVDDLEIGGGGRYTLDIEFRDAAGRAAALSFSGRFEAGWWGGHGYAWPVYDTIPSPDGVGAPPEPIIPSGTFWLGPTRYDVRLDYGWPPSYRQNEDGSWEEVWHPNDPVPFRDGGYWTEGVGGFYATITPAQTPEAGTLALAGIGLGVASVVRRRRSTR